MKLTVKERLALLSVLPARGNLEDLRIVRDLQGALSFSEAEQKEIGFERQEDGRMQWSSEPEPAEIDVGPRAREIICAAFERLDKAEQLTLEHLPVYERFVDADEPNIKEVRNA